MISVSGLNLADNQCIILPYTVSGNIAAGSGPPTDLNVAAIQIDGGNLVEISGGSLLLPFDFNFELNASQGFQVNTWYLINIYFWDNIGDCTVETRTFQVSDPS